MEFEKLQYTGAKPYTDRLSKNEWQPEDIKLVPAGVARKLLRYVEFRRPVKDVEPQQAALPAPVEPQGEQPRQPAQHDQPTDAELQQAMEAQRQTEQLAQQERAALESMLLTVETMDKGALTEYAAKYEVKLDARKGEAKLRAEVANLVEQFGAR